MGLCQTKQYSILEDGKQLIKTAIKLHDYKTLAILIKKLKRENNKGMNNFNINSTIMHLNNIKLNSLGYALWQGDIRIFNQLQKSGALIAKMEKRLNKGGKSSMHIICERGYILFFQWFLPIWEKKLSYLNLAIDEAEQSEMLSCFRTKNVTINQPLSNYTPLQLAVWRGRNNLVKYIYSIYKNQKQIQPEFDTNYRNEFSNENCGLLAIRRCNLQLIKYLYQETDTDFFILNSFEENGINIAAAWSSHFPSQKWLKLIMYLVETIGLDITYKHEESLLSCNTGEISNYIEKQLQKHQIYVTKLEIDRKNRIDYNRSMGQQEYDYEKFFLENSGKLNESTSIVSSIALTSQSQSFTTILI